ncbi:Chaperone protein DnaJ 2 [Thelohanellus kitauei]|uniref:Chaperone protein DnaJ 2 n=1 Tax=Thelohanellus kitauei TaxID=669202 RepID=A0A0C2MPW7_THEKT|nr:Chaperone protein DnaJ 2 [Thelohanellus kitauei]
MDKCNYIRRLLIRPNNIPHTSKRGIGQISHNIFNSLYASKALIGTPNYLLKTFKTSTLNLADYYSVLGLKPSATQDEIKKAYFKKVKEYHPDVNKAPNATEKFREVQEAYEVLGKPDSKRMYDTRGSTSGSKSQTSQSRASRASQASQSCILLF